VCQGVAVGWFVAITHRSSVPETQRCHVGCISPAGRIPVSERREGR
jgi:hypothetical protein